MLPERKAVLTTGDFNICNLMNRTNILIDGLEANGLKQLVQEATYIKGRHIDHEIGEIEKENGQSLLLTGTVLTILIMMQSASQF